MNSRVLLALCLGTVLLAAANGSWAQGDQGQKREPPRFFFEKGGGLAKPADQPPPAKEAPPATREGEPTAPAKPAFDFETAESLAVWHPLDAEALVDLATEENVAHAGKGCLRFTYSPREGVFEQLSARPLQVGDAQALAFWIMTDSPTNLSFGVVEKGGAFYQQFAYVPPEEWTPICVPLNSLLLSQDTTDASGKLEPTEITEIRLADLTNLPGGLGDALGRKTGVQQMLLDDVAIGDQPAPPVGTTSVAPLLADGFERTALHALAIGGAVLRRTEGPAGHALEVLCQEAGSRWKGFVMAVGQLDLTDAKELSLRLKASQPLLLNVTLEEWDNSKYCQRIGIDPADGWTEKLLPLDRLLLDTTSTDENGALDREQIRVLVIVADMTRADQFPLTFGVDEVQFR